MCKTLSDEIEDQFDYETGTKALEQHKTNPETYSIGQVADELGIKFDNFTHNHVHSFVYGGICIF